MVQQARLDALADRLQALGPPRMTSDWCEGDPNYIKKFGLTSDDLPELIRLAQEWPEAVRDGNDWAPIHAWRAAAQMHALGLLRPLLDMAPTLDELHDQWYLQDFPVALAMLGPVVLDEVADYLADDNKPLYPRACAAEGLARLAHRHPEVRDEAADRLARQLGQFDAQDSTLNGFLTVHLVHLHAADAAPIIEKAYSAGVIDESLAGDWPHVREELGVEGLGLVPEKEPERTVPDTSLVFPPVGAGLRTRDDLGDLTEEDMEEAVGPRERTLKSRKGRRRRS